MSAYPMHPTAAAAPSPHTGFVQPGAAAPTPGANMYSTNSTPFSNPYSATTRQAAYNHHQQHSSGSAVQPHYQQFSGCTSQPTPPASASMTATSGSQQKHPTGGSFQVAQHTQNASTTVQNFLPGGSVLSSHSVVPPAEEAVDSPEEIAHSFVYQYYYKLYQNPKDMYTFYEHDSKMTRVSDSQNELLVGSSDENIHAVGLPSIMEAFQKLNFYRATSRIHIIEAQEALNGGTHVLVIGTLKHAPNKPERDFVQSVLLAKFRPPRTGWYVHREMLCYLDGAMEAAGCRALKAHDEQVRAQDDLIRRHRALRQQQEEDEAQRRLEQQQLREQAGLESPVQNQQSERGIETCAAGSKSKPDETRPTGSTGGVQKERRQKPSAVDVVGSKHPEMGKDSSRPPEGEQAAVQEGKVDESDALKTARGDERITNKWAKEDVTEKVSEQSPNWPKPGELPEQPKNASAGSKSSDSQKNTYTPGTFAYTVVKNAPPIAQKGFAVPATAQSAPPRGANGVHKEAGDFASPRGRVGPSGSGPSQTNKKLTVLEDIPDVTDPDEIKKAVDERLLRFNEGQVVEIKKPSSGRTYGMTIEVDCHQSAQYLVNNGLYINGRQVRIEFARPRGSIGGLSRGRGGGMAQRGTWEERRNSSDARRGYYRYNKAPFSGGASHERSQEGRQNMMPDEVDGQWIDAGRRRPRASRGGFGGRGNPGSRFPTKKTQHE